MKDAVRRALRTFIQGFIGVLSLVAIPQLTNIVNDVVDGRAISVNLDIWQSIIFAAIAGGVIALISWVQNEVEDTTGKAVLKEPAPKTTRGSGTV